MSVSVVIVTFFSHATLAKLVQQLHKESCVHEIIVVDNSLDANEVQKIKHIANKYSCIFLPSEKNNGFADGCNRGAKMAKAEYVAFINPDVSLPSQSFEKLLNVYQQEQADIVAPVMVNTKNVLEYTAGYFPQITFRFWHWLLLVPHHELATPKETLRVDWITGAFMLMKKNLFIELGMFNSTYFMYYEDLDLCMRAYQMKKKIIYTPQVKAIHNAHSSVKLIAEKTKKNWYDSSKHLFNKTYRGRLLAYIHELFYR